MEAWMDMTSLFTWFAFLVVAAFAVRIWFVLLRAFRGRRQPQPAAND